MSEYDENKFPEVIHMGDTDNPDTSKQIIAYIREDVVDDLRAKMEKAEKLIKAKDLRLRVDDETITELSKKVGQLEVDCDQLQAANGELRGALGKARLILLHYSISENESVGVRKRWSEIADYAEKALSTTPPSAYNRLKALEEVADTSKQFEMFLSKYAIPVNQEIVKKFRDALENLGGDKNEPTPNNQGK